MFQMGEISSDYIFKDDVEQSLSELAMDIWHELY